MADPVHVGIIGAGYWGKKLIHEYLALERKKHNVKLAKVCDSSLSSLLTCKKTFAIDDDCLTQNVRDLIEDTDISAVHIATPNQTHYALARMALQAGKNTLVEKPMTLRSREAYELVDLAASKGLVLHVGHVFRFNSALREARKILDTGMIGKIFYARVRWTDHCPPFPDRDIIFDLGPHPIDVLNQLLEAWPSRVNAFGRAYRNSREHNEIAYGVAEFPEGIFAHIELSWLQPGKTREVSIVGSDGTLAIDCLSQRLSRLDGSSTEEIPIPPPNNTIEAEIDWFADCVVRGAISVGSGLIGARTVEVLESMRASMLEGPREISEPSTNKDVLALVDMLQMAGDAVAQYLAKSEGSQIERYAGVLLRLGLIREDATERGTSYEITDDGLRFLREYRDAGSRSPRLRQFRSSRLTG